MNRILKFSLLNPVFKHFFSFTCPSCKSTIVKSTNGLCPVCKSKLNFITSPYCKCCGGSLNTVLSICSKCIKEEKHPWKQAISIFEMKGLSRDLIIKFKYYNDISLVRPLAKYCTDKLASENISPDLITYIPLHWLKYFRRSFNQSELIAKYISKRTDIPVCSLLKRRKYTKSQTKLNNQLRRKNVIGAFRANNLKKIINKKILLIDDVYTTGTTLREASKILLKAKAKEVYILTLARK